MGRQSKHEAAIRARYCELEMQMDLAKDRADKALAEYETLKARCEDLESLLAEAEKQEGEGDDE